MQLIVYGTKGGFKKSFDPARTEHRKDVAPTSPKEKAIGQEAYAINFNEENVIFSKYRIVCDLKGEKRTGYIGFLLITPHGQKLETGKVKQLLDRLSEEYVSKGGGYIDEYNNLHYKREKWDFIDDLIKEYETKLVKREDWDIDSISQGGGAPAYMYYQKEEELDNYIDFPYQRIYSNYRMVFLVDKKYEGEDSNPLNALMHDPLSNLTGKIDFTIYELETPEVPINNVNIHLKVNGQSDRAKVKMDDLIEIIFLRRYYKTQITKGTLENLLKGKYLDKESGNAIRINESKIPKSFEQETKNILLKALGENGEEISNAIFKISSGSESLNENRLMPNRKGTKVEFRGEEIGKKWTITAVKKGWEMQGLNDYELIPKLANKEHPMFMKEKREEISIQVVGDDNKPIKSFTISPVKKNKDIKVDGKDVILFGLVTEKGCFIRIRAKGYESETVFLSPENGSPEIILKKKRKKITSSMKKGSRAKKSVKKPLVFALFALGLVAILISDRFHIFEKSPEKSAEERVRNYLEGNELILDSLNIYHGQYCSKPENATQSGGSTFIKFLPWWGKSQEKAQSMSNKLCPRISSKKGFRKLLNGGMIDSIEIIDTFFSSEQRSIKVALEKAIEDTAKISRINALIIEDSLVISQMNLDSVARYLHDSRKYLEIEGSLGPKVEYVSQWIEDLSILTFGAKKEEELCAKEYNDDLIKKIEGKKN